jgi:hypothetical protein
MWYVSSDSFLVLQKKKGKSDQVSWYQGWYQLHKLTNKGCVLLLLLAIYSSSLHSDSKNLCIRQQHAQFPFNSFSLTELAEMQYFFLTLSLSELAEMLRSHTENPTTDRQTQNDCFSLHCRGWELRRRSELTRHPPAHPGWWFRSCRTKHCFLVNSCSVTLNHGGWLAMD